MSLGPDEYHASAKANLEHLVLGTKMDLGEVAQLAASLGLAGHPDLKVWAIKIGLAYESVRESLMELQERFNAMEAVHERERQRDSAPLQGNEAEADGGGVGAPIPSV